MAIHPKAACDDLERLNTHPVTSAAAASVVVTGFVTVGAAALIGIITAVICNLAQLLMEKYGRKYVDDTLDVFACHGVGGTVGQFLVGLFATTAVNSAGADGAFYGNPMLVGKDLLVLVILIPWLIVATLLCLWVTNLVLELRAAGAWVTHRKCVHTIWA